MRKLLMAAVALTAVTAAPAFAAPTVANYTVSGDVTAVCAATATGAIPFGSLTDGNGTLNATDKETSDTTAYCNGGGTKVQIGHVDLTHKTFTGTPPTGFVKVVSFTPEVAFGSGTGAVTKTGDQASGTSLAAFSGMVVRAKGPSVTSGTKPLAGDYEGSITVTLTPGA